jgi:hypothetical protein
MLWLSDELFKQRNKTIKITIGKTILGSEIAPNLNDFAAAQEIRKTVYSLKN